MAMFSDLPTRPAAYARFERDAPEWYKDAKLGIFIHWGPYSVPAWAEPVGPLGGFPDATWWFTHNPYAEWYGNTIRIEGSPARAHQLATYGNDDYDQFVDLWQAEEFDASKVMDVFASTGARYFVPVAKHHDGFALWDASNTGTYNAVQRGPKRDLISELHEATLAHDMRFGLYYSGGLDWHFAPMPPIAGDINDEARPLGKEYADYAFDQVIELIDRYQPAVLWGDIEWPDAGKAPGQSKNLVEMFDHFYDRVPDGLVNDRWGETHWDIRTSEYLDGLDAEEAPIWENCRGIGFSFGYNQMETQADYLTGAQIATHFVDVVSRGGNFLLNVGLTAAGRIPEIQERALTELAKFNERHGEAIFGSRAVASGIVPSSDEPWVRWTTTTDRVHAFVLAPEGGRVDLPSTLTDLIEVERPVVVGDAEISLDASSVLVKTFGDYPVRISFQRRLATDH